MRALFYFAVSFLLLTGCSAGNDPVMSKIEQLNLEASRIVPEKSNRLVTELFDRVIERTFYNSVCSNADVLRDDAFMTEDFTKADLFADKAKPVYRIVFGGDANFIGPDVEFFFGKCVPGTVEYRFFELALTGWVDLGGEMHGGKENFPAWIKQIDGLSGNFIPDAGAEALKKWQALLPELNGNYKQIALNTIAYIEGMTDGDED